MLQRFCLVGLILFLGGEALADSELRLTDGFSVTSDYEAFTGIIEPVLHKEMLLMSEPDKLSLSLWQRRQNIQALQTLAVQLREQKIPGVELWSRLVRDVVARYQVVDLPAARRCDVIVQDLALVILGPAAIKYLNWFEQITPDAWEDPLVKQFFDDFKAFDLPPIGEPLSPAWRDHGYAGKLDEERDPGLDQYFAADFRPALNDQTDNQVFHTFFYHFMAYVTQAEQTIRAASVYHETFDKGGSIEDHTAALIAVQTGKLWRRQRDSDEAAEKITDWPALIQVAYAKDGVARLQGDISPAVQAHAERIEALLNHPEPWESLQRSAEYALIELVKMFSAHKP